MLRLSSFLPFRRPRRPTPPLQPPLLSEAQAAELTAALQPIATPPVRRQSRGRVIKETRHAEYDPRNRHRGGRIVRTMPRQLQKLKQAQEKVEDDSDQLKVEDLPE